MIRVCTRIVQTRSAIRGYAVVARRSDCSDYLLDCKSRGVNINSTVFRGTLYEYVSKTVLEELLQCHELQRTGGAYDQGIDLTGKWNLGYYFNLNREAISHMAPSKMTRSNNMTPIVKISSEYKSLAQEPSEGSQLSLTQDISVLVQCKNYGSKVSGATVRELIGIYLHHVKRSQHKSTFMFLVSPAPLTKQAYGIIDQASIPILHLTLSPLILANAEVDSYDVTNWTGGSIGSVYMNKCSSSLLKYLNLELQLSKIKNTTLTFQPKTVDQHWSSKLD